MKKFRDYSFSNQLVFFAILIGVLLSTGITTVVIWQTRVMLEHEGLKHLESTAEDQVKKINEKFDHFESYTSFFIDSDLFPTYFANYKNDSAKTIKVLFNQYNTRFLNSFNIEGIRVFDSYGKSIYEAQNTSSLTPPEKTNKFEKEFTYGTPYMEGDQHFINSYASINSQESIISVVFKINLSDIYSSINDTSGLGMTGETLLGIKTDSGAMFINPLRFDKDAAFKRQVSKSDRNATPILKSTNGINGKGRSIDYRGKLVLATWKHIPKLDWGLVAKVDLEEVYDPLFAIKIKIIGLAVFFCLLSVVIAFFFSRSTVRPINKLREVITQLSEGHLVKNVNIQINQDEIGQMTKAALDLATFQNNIIEFTKNVSEKEFDKNEEINIDRGEIGEALKGMSDNLQKVEKEDRMRSWANEGIAKFSDIIRDLSNKSDELSSKLISELVEYTNSNQGGLFILNDEKDQLEQLSFYAYDREKFAEQTLEKGDGLNWQAIVEKETIHLIEVPEDYIEVTSGLGGAVPTAVLLVPLVINEEVYGVIELAAFQKYETHQIEFVEKVAESVASAISNMMVNEKTRKLLESSQNKTQELTAQEEEMRQNLEEMQATQEEMGRIQTDLASKEAMLRNLVDNNQDTYFCMDRDYKILVANKALKERFRKDGIEVKEGATVFEYYSPEQKKMWKEKYDRILNGEAFTDVIDRKVGDKTIYVEAIYSPIYDENEEIIGASVLSRDVTTRVKMEKRIAELEKKLNDES